MLTSAVTCYRNNLHISCTENVATIQVNVLSKSVQVIKCHNYSQQLPPFSCSLTTLLGSLSVLMLPDFHFCFLWCDIMDCWRANFRRIRCCCFGDGFLGYYRLYEKFILTFRRNVLLSSSVFCWDRIVTSVAAAPISGPHIPLIHL